MKTRLISIVCMLPLLIFLVIGGVPLLLVVMLVSGAALYEFYNGFENLEIKASKPVGLALLVVLYMLLFAFCYYSDSFEMFSVLQGMWITLSVFICLLLIIIDKNHNILGPTYTLLGVFYVGYMLSHLYLIEKINHSMVLLPVVIACMADTGGYFGGMYFGKHKLAPTLSPKKTVEGSIGGLIAGTLSSLIYGLIIMNHHLGAMIVMGIFGSVLAELGDLVASAFKRKMGIKDYSNLIPGHGGVLDRVDSFIFVFPFVYYFIVLFINR